MSAFHPLRTFRPSPGRRVCQRKRAPVRAPFSLSNQKDGGAEGEISLPRPKESSKNLRSRVTKRPSIQKSPAFPPLISGCKVGGGATRRVSMEAARQRKAVGSHHLAHPTVAVIAEPAQSQQGTPRIESPGMRTILIASERR